MNEGWGNNAAVERHMPPSRRPSLPLSLVSSYNVCEKSLLERVWVLEEKIIEAVSMSHMCTV